MSVFSPRRFFDHAELAEHCTGLHKMAFSSEQDIIDKCGRVISLEDVPMNDPIRRQLMPQGDEEDFMVKVCEDCIWMSPRSSLSFPSGMWVFSLSASCLLVGCIGDSTFCGQSHRKDILRLSGSDSPSFRV